MIPDSATPTEEAQFVTLIIKPFRLEAVLSALRPFHVDSLAVSQVRGYGRQKGHLELYSGAEYVISFIPKLLLEFAIPTAEIDAMIQAVRHAARTGRIGDGKLFFQKGLIVVD